MLTQSRRPVDVVILPVSLSASFKPCEDIYPGYTGIATVLNFTAAVIPVIRANATIDDPLTEYTPQSDMDRKN